jgi:thymidylate synthase
MIAQVTNHKRGRFVHSFGDAHIYSNHIDQVKQQLSRRDDLFEFPILELNPEIREIDDFKFDDILLIDYKSHKSIKAPIAV